MGNRDLEVVFVISVNFRNTDVYAKLNVEKVWQTTILPGGIDWIIDFINYLQTEHDLRVGRMAAETTLLILGSVTSPKTNGKTSLRGRNLKTDLPGEVEITSTQISEALKFHSDILAEKMSDIFRIRNTEISDEHSILSRIPSEFKTSLSDKPIVLTGEFGKLRGLAETLGAVLKVPITISEEQ